ncbi:MAG: SGNH/GDSL hydrolase family protein [Spirochaetales bacterium]|jgi:lysophospholipase L1-like esterase|nr:SGNH/GDSL hydrolase family protein [Spirochaetales bacterium]
MHTILCYGDSNTFGTNPGGGRWAVDQRWTGLLASMLGPSYRIIEEGLGGRTTVFDDPLEPKRNGLEYLPVSLQSHRPLDLVILSLGTNDCKSLNNANERIIAKGLEKLVVTVRNHPYGPGYPIPQVLVISPIHIGDDIESSIFASFDKGSAALSKRLADSIKVMAEQQHAYFFDAATVAASSPIDQLHMDKESHACLAKALHPLILSVFGEAETPKLPVEEAPRAKFFGFLKR